jgi:SNF2 family DNA or RNA helicase
LVCGYLVTDDKQVIEVENNRINAMMDIIEETGKVIIWATYRKDIQLIAATLAKKFGDDSVCTYYGDTTSNERAEAVQRFQKADDALRFFVGNPKVGGYGVTLTEASTVIYYSNSYDLEVRLQSEDRAHRIGQTKNVTYVDLVARGTIDEKILKALRSKRDLAAEVLGDPKTFMEWLQ